MNNKIIGYWAFFILSLSLAYAASEQNDEVSKKSIRWLDIKAGQLESLTYATDSSQSKVYRDSNGTYWVEDSVVDKSGSEGDANNVEENDSTVAKPSEKTFFKLNEDAEKFIPKWTFLAVEKVIGKASELELSKFGLDKKKAKIEILDKSGNSRVFSVGEQSFKSPFQFLIDEKTNEVILVAKDLVDKLRTLKSNFFEAELFPQKDLQSIKVQSENKAINFKSSRQNVSEDGKEIISWKVDGVEANKSVDIWVNKLLSLRIRDYSLLSTPDIGSEYESNLFISVEGKKGNSKTYVIYKKALEDGYEYWVRLDNELSIARLPTKRIDTLLDDFKVNL